MDRGSKSGEPGPTKKDKKSKKVAPGGLELPRRLVFKNWEPGGEYTLPLHLKNVKLRTQKVFFRLTSDIFSIPPCDLPVTMFSGTSHTLNVTYRPFEKLHQETVLELWTDSEKDKMKVVLEAALPYPGIALPDSLTFGKCALHEAIYANFEMSNSGDAPAHYYWSVPEEFSIEPVDGLISPGETQKFKAIFSPLAAKVYEGTATGVFSDRPRDSSGMEMKVGGYNFKKTMGLEGVGKLVYLTAKPKLTSEDYTKETDDEEKQGKTFEEFRLNFGIVPVGYLKEMKVKVFNTSKVLCHFSVHPLDPDNPQSMFFCDENERELESECSATVKVSYAPCRLNDHLEGRYFVIKSDSGYGVIKFRCVGQCEGPCVVISNDKSVLDFGNVQCEKSSSAVLRLTNVSGIPAVFQIQSSSSSVFSCRTLSGSLEAQSSCSIPVKFSPSHSIPYCRLVYIIVQHQEPLAICFIGSGYAESQTPVILKPEVLARYLEHAKSGVSLLPPQKLRDLLESKEIVSHPKSGVLKAKKRDSRVLPTPEQFGLPNPYCTNCTYFNCQNEMSSIQHITSDVDILKFNYCAPGLSTVAKYLSITNHTLGEVSCMWMQEPLKHFSIIPKKRSIGPGKKATFAVFFRPDRADEFYYSELECFVFYSELRDYHHVSQFTVTPPWCVTATLTGHSFSKPFDYSSPLSPSDELSLYFSPTLPNVPVFLTVLLNNTSLSATLYDIPALKGNGEFRVKPSHGLLGEGPRIVTLQLLTGEATDLWQHQLQYHLSNPAASQVKDVTLYGCCRAPTPSILKDSKMFFKPTGVLSYSQQYSYVQNPTEFPMKFRWKVSVLDRDVFNVDRKSGVLEPNETQVHKWLFYPPERGEFISRVTLVSSFAYLPVEYSTTLRTWLDLYGMGEVGVLQCEPTSLDFGGLTVHSDTSHTFILKNPSLCDIRYVLEVDAVAADGTVPKVPPVEVSPVKSVVYSRSTKPVQVNVKPTVIGEFVVSLKYRLDDCEKEDTSVHELSEVKFISTYPTLRVTDVLGRGSLAILSKVSLWKILRIDELNNALMAEPSKMELRYAINTRHSLRRKMPVLTETIMKCDFGVAPVDSKDTSTSFKLKNDGLIDTKWAFRMPMDVWVNPETWADNEELNEAEEHESFILNNRIMSVSPTSGVLKPKQTVVVTFKYKHSHVGIHKLPVLLKIDMGREVLLIWHGTTAPKGEPFLHVNVCDKHLAPTYVASHTFVKQFIPIYNGGDTEAEYEVDVAALRNLDVDNYNMPLFQCLQPKGTVGPGKRKLVECLFSPMEATRYTIGVPVMLSNGERTTVVLTADAEFPGDAISSVSVQRKYTGGRDAIVDESQVAQLSELSVNYGCIPQFAVVHKLLFIANTSEHLLSFSWTTEDSRFSQVIRVSPNEGFLEPGKSQACSVNFHGSQPPSIYNFNLQCSVVDESEMEVYQAAMKAWHEKLEDQKQFILICDNSSRFVQREVYDSTVEEQKKVDKVVKKENSDTQQTYEEWKQTELYKRSKKRPPAFPKKDEKNIPPPVEPKPLEMCVSLRAEVLSVRDFVARGGSLEDFFMEYGSLDQHADSPGDRRITEKENDCLVTVFNQVLRGLLDDENFQDSLDEVKEEPIPYFKQFSHQTQLARGEKLDTGSEQKPKQNKLQMASDQRPCQLQMDQDMKPKSKQLKHGSGSEGGCMKHPDSDYRSSARPDSGPDDVLGVVESQALGVTDTPSIMAPDMTRELGIGEGPLEQGIMENMMEKAMKEILMELETDRVLLDDIQ